MTRLYAQNASPKNRQKIRLNNLILLSLRISMCPYEFPGLILLATRSLDSIFVRH